MKVLTKLGWQDIPATKETGSYKITLDNGDSFQVNGDAEMYVITKEPTSIFERRETNMVKVDALQKGQRLISGIIPDAPFSRMYLCRPEMYNLLSGVKSTIKDKTTIITEINGIETQVKSGNRINKNDLIKYGTMLLHSTQTTSSDEYNRYADIYNIPEYVIKYMEEIFHNVLHDSTASSDIADAFTSRHSSMIVKILSLVLVGFTANHMFTGQFNDNDEIVDINLDINIPSSTFFNQRVKMMVECMKYICNFDEDAFEISKVIAGCKHITIKGITNISKFLLAIGMKEDIIKYCHIPAVYSYRSVVNSTFRRNLNCSINIDNINVFSMIWYPAIVSVEPIIESINVSDSTGSDNASLNDISNSMLGKAIMESDIMSKLGWSRRYSNPRIVDKKLINGYWGKF